MAKSTENRPGQGFDRGHSGRGVPAGVPTPDKGTEHNAGVDSCCGGKASWPADEHKHDGMKGPGHLG